MSAAPTTRDALQIAGEVGMPQAPDHERAVLSTCLVDQNAMDTAAVLVEPADFYALPRRTLWMLLSKLHSEGKPTDRISVMQRLVESGNVGSIGQISDYLDNLPSGAGVLESYCRVLRVHSIRRQAIVQAEALRQKALNGGDAEELIAELQRAGDALSGRQHRGTKLLRVDEAYLRDFEGKFPNFVGETAKTRAFPIPWEEVLGGLRMGEMTVLAARPGVGKSSAAAQIAFEGAKKGHGVHFWTLEMRSGVTLRRAMSALSQVSHYRLSSGWLRDDEKSRVFAALGEACEAPLLIADDASVTVEQIRAELRQAKAAGRLPDLVVVDYLQLLHGIGQNRNDVVSQITRGLKRITLEFGIAVLALSQLSRSSEKDGKREPLLSDLRDSGSIEQDADNVVFIHRSKEDEDEDAKVLEVKWLVKKQRNGHTGTTTLAFKKDLMRFEKSGSFPT